MEKREEFLKQVAEFQDHCIEKAFTLLNARGATCALLKKLDSVEFYEDGVYIRFMEDTWYGGPDFETIHLKPAEIDMNENEWAEYLTRVSSEIEQKRQEEIEVQRQRDYEKKKRDYERLKSELGL